MDAGHLFILQDDVIIKNTQVFKKYIQTAKIFNIEHLNFCRRWLANIQQEQQPCYGIKYKDTGLQFFNNLCGLFQYFTRNCIDSCGYMDQNYINALQHAEHTYRICLNNMYVPGFHMFADIIDSNLYLEDGGKITTIENNQAYKINLINALNRFTDTYKIHISQLKRPEIKEIQQFYTYKILG